MNHILSVWDVASNSVFRSRANLKNSKYLARHKFTVAIVVLEENK